MLSQAIDCSEELGCLQFTLSCFIPVYGMVGSLMKTSYLHILDEQIVREGQHLNPSCETKMNRAWGWDFVTQGIREVSHQYEYDNDNEHIISYFSNIQMVLHL
jgi:hypothetical protein